MLSLPCAGGTNTYTALQTVREQILIPANGRRPEVPAVVLVVTDGESWNVNRTKSEASLLKNLDVNILALGIGSNVSLNELNGISSGFVQNISDFDSLDGIVDSLRGQLCKSESKKIHNWRCVSVCVYACRFVHLLISSTIWDCFGLTVYCLVLSCVIRYSSEMGLTRASVIFA